jgi:DNA modification methylase
MPVGTVTGDAGTLKRREEPRSGSDRVSSLSLQTPLFHNLTGRHRHPSGMERLMHQIQMVRTDRLKENPKNVRTHSNKQIGQVARSIEKFGFVVPVLIDEDDQVIAGHARISAAKQLGHQTIPVIVLTGLSEAKKRALGLADNKIPQNAGWDRERLALELTELSELLIQEDIDIEITGFEPVEIDQLQVDFEESSCDPSDEIGASYFEGPIITQHGDVWRLHDHRLACGDARNGATVAALMEGQRAAMGFLDVPYNLPSKAIGGRGRTKHPDFVMASGEMTVPEFVSFLTVTLGAAAKVSTDAALHFVCCDWRHIAQLIEASGKVYEAMLNLVVWDKTNAGQGSFYRSQHELIGVFRVGGGGHLNNIELGRHGRNRSNVWRYAGVNSFRAGRMEDLQAHPTSKPIALVADAIRDCTRRGEIVLDTFCGGGTTILAAERVGRRGYGLEADPRYVDVAIKRWQAFTGRDAVNLRTHRTFAEHHSGQQAAKTSNRTRRPAAGRTGS